VHRRRQRDASVREILPFVSRPVTTYGFSADAQVRATEVHADGPRMCFTVRRRDRQVELPPLDITLNLPGEHNVRNALATIAVATELGVPDDAIREALAAFKGVNRRFTQAGVFPVKAEHGGGSFTLIDDYGHHPVEMAATLAAARGAYPRQRIVLAFQPHRYTRTRDCFEDFVKVLGTADALLLAEVYAAGEPPIVAADGRSLARAVRVAGKVEPVFVEDIADMPQAIADFARDSDVVIAMGAGSIGSMPARMGALFAPVSDQEGTRQ